MDNTHFKSIVYHKLSGWYSRQEWEDMAVERICKVRDEFRNLLSEIRRDGIPQLLEYLDECGFYYRPSSGKRHHNYPGGLAEHCLGVYEKMQKCKVSGAGEDSIKLAGLFHDLCKCDMYYFNGRTILHHSRHGHGSRSVRLLRKLGVVLTSEEYRAIRYHMWSAKDTEKIRIQKLNYCYAKNFGVAEFDTDHRML